MKIAFFDTYELAFAKLQELSNLAKTSTSTEPFILTKVNESLLGFWWFVFDPDCLAHAGLGRPQILLKELEMDILELDEIPANWSAPLDEVEDV